MSSASRWRPFLLTASMLGIVACGGTVEPAGGAGSGGNGQGGNAGGGDGAGGDGKGGNATGCSGSAPPDGQACSPVGVECEYDEGVLLECRPRSTCTETGWQTLSPNCISDPPPDPSCPGSEPSGNCTVAADPSLCVYESTICGCSDCLGGPCGGQAQWVCAPAPSAPCPPGAPALGTACENEGLSCVYGSCSLTVLGGRSCSDGVWVDEDILCPL